MSEKVYRIVLKGSMVGQESFDQMLQNLEELSKRAKNVTIVIGETGKTGETSLNRIARSVLRVGFMVNMFESSLMRLEMANFMVANAQDRVNDAMKKSGPASEDAIRAQRRLAQMIQYTNRANTRAAVSTGLLTTQIVLQSGILEKATMTKLAHGLAVASTTVKHYAEIAALKIKATLQGMTQPWMVPAMLAGGAAVGAGVAMLATAGNQYNVEVNINQEGDFEEAMDQAKREATYELRRQG